MSAAVGLASFAEGFAQSKIQRDQRADAAKAREQQDRMIDALGAIPQGGGYSYPQGGTPPFLPPGSGGLGYGTAGGGRDGSDGSDGSLFGLIDKTEGGGNYDTLFGHAQNGGQFAGVKVSEMTLDQLSDFASPSGAYGQWVKGKVNRVATPMGRHQIVGTTLRNTARAMGLPGNAKFDGKLQDDMAAYLASQRLKGASSPSGKRAALRAEWEGFKNVSDSALDEAIAKFEANGGTLQSRPMGAPPQTGPQL